VGCNEIIGLHGMDSGEDIDLDINSFAGVRSIKAREIRRLKNPMEINRGARLTRRRAEPRTLL